MRILAIASLFLCALPSGSMADKPKVSRAAIRALEDSFDNRLRGIWPEDPAEVLGVTQGAYISGNGAVFLSELNLAPTAGISPFHPAITKDEFTRIHAKKLSRLPKLKAVLEEMLLDSSGAPLDSMPVNEQITVGVTLFYWRGENTEGLPAQIVMHAPKRVLASVKAGTADKATLATALTVEEY